MLEANQRQTTDCSKTIFLQIGVHLKQTEDKLQTAVEWCLSNRGILGTNWTDTTDCPWRTLFRQNADCLQMMLFRQQYNWNKLMTNYRLPQNNVSFTWVCTWVNWRQSADCPRARFLSHWCVLEWTEDKVQTAPEQCFSENGILDWNKSKTNCQVPQNDVSQKRVYLIEKIKDKLKSAPEQCFSEKGILDWKIKDKLQTAPEPCFQTELHLKESKKKLLTGPSILHL